MRYRIAITILTIIALSFVVNAQDAEFKPVRQMLEARQMYDEALSSQDTEGFIAASDSYEDTYNRLIQHPELDKLYEFLSPKAAYRKAWCFYRIAELTGDNSYLDSALDWFVKVPMDAPDTVGHWARFMVGEILLQKAIRLKFDSLAVSGSVTTTVVDSLDSLLIRADRAFNEGIQSNLVSDEVAAASRFRRQDVLFEQTLLALAAHDSSRADSQLDLINYTGVSDGLTENQASDLNEAVQYNQAVLAGLERLVRPDDNILRSRFSGVSQHLGSDTDFWEGSMALVDKQYQDAVTQFGSIRRSAEADYWQSYARILRVSSKQFRMASDTLRYLVERTWRNNRNLSSRLQSLRLDALHKNYVLNLVGVRNRPFDSDSLRILHLEDVQFIIRVAAYFTSWRPTTCARLDMFLEDYALDAGIDNDAIDFYKAVSKTLVALANADDTGLRDAASIFQSIAGDKYRREANLFAASNLSHGIVRDFDVSRAITESLVASDSSIRALALLMEIEWARFVYKLGGDADRACSIAQLVYDRSQGCEFTFLRTAARAILNECNNLGSNTTASINISGAFEVECPDSLLIDTIGGRPQLVYAESLAKKELVPAALREECLRLLRIYGQPKRMAYIAREDRQLSRAKFPERVLDGYHLGIPDEVYLNSNWKPEAVFVDASGNWIESPLGCRTYYVNQSRKELECNQTTLAYKYKVNDSLQIGDFVEITTSGNEYYPTKRQYTCPDPRIYSATIALANKVSFTPGSNWDKHFKSNGNHSETNAILIAKDASLSIPGKLTKMIQNNPGYRDVAWDAANDRFLIVNCNKPNRLIIASKDGKLLDPINLNFPSDTLFHLVSPEGLTIAPNGTIYVADWGNHRVAMFDSTGMYLGEFGNDILRLPTRIALQRDITGVAAGDTTAYRQDFLIVADHNGVHRFDIEGKYLDSPVPETQGDFKARSYYTLGVTGYGKNSVIAAGDPNSNEVTSFTADTAE